MSLTGSLYSGITGLQAHSQQMSIIGNNLANVSTTGYKSSNMQFQDLFYQAVNTASGVGQVGNGVTVSSINTNFAQGSYESTASATDVAIGGEGFYVVRNPDSNEQYYTRAGNLVFDSEGYLVDANGFRVQGWQVQQGSSGGSVDLVGSYKDIQLENFQSPPQATSQVNMFMNLDSTSEDYANVPSQPFFSMLDYWDGTADTPLATSRYSYQNTIKVYDENGTAHEATVYFDPVKDSAVTSSAGGNIHWEFIVTVPPSSDGRAIDGQTVGATSSAGLLMAGTLTFNSAGELTGMSSYTLGSNASGDLKDLSNWTQAEFNDEGYCVCTANFSGLSNASATTEANANNLGINLGVTNTNTSGTGWSGTASNASLVGSAPTNLNNFATPQVEAISTTCFDSSSTTMSQSQNGYSAGFLQSVSINRDGVITGNYSNGQILDLYALTLANFNNPNALNREGSNLFSATVDSGVPTTGVANTGALGSISSNTLEQSNVDMATEMVKLITTQRGFQANSKVITTADTMLGEVIQLKR